MGARSGAPPPRRLPLPGARPAGGPARSRDSAASRPRQDAHPGPRGGARAHGPAGRSGETAVAAGGPTRTPSLGERARATESSTAQVGTPTPSGLPQSDELFGRWEGLTTVLRHPPSAVHFGGKSSTALQDSLRSLRGLGETPKAVPSEVRAHGVPSDCVNGDLKREAQPTQRPDHYEETQHCQSHLASRAREIWGLESLQGRKRGGPLESAV